MTPWLLVDYGEVISLAYDATVQQRVATLLGITPETLSERYWPDRLALDAGLPSDEYWSRVAGRTVSVNEARELDRVDIAGWARLDPRMLDLLDEQAAAGVRLALLSNAPLIQAQAFDELAWTDRFEHVFVSSRIGLVKPDPAIYAHAVAAMGADPGEVTFVDDKEVNVDGAVRAGLRGVVFRGVDRLRRDLG